MGVNSIIMSLQGALSADGGCSEAGNYDTGSETLTNHIVRTHFSLTLETFPVISVDKIQTLPLDKSSPHTSGYDSEFGTW